MRTWKQTKSLCISVILCFVPIRIENSVMCINASAEPPGKTEIVCTTTHISAVVDAVGGGLFETQTVIPYGMCPGHFDLSPGEARTLLEAPLVLYHGYEQFLKGIDFAEKNNLVSIRVNGNWMVPDIHIEAAGKITEILSGVEKEYSDRLAVRAKQYTSAITASEDSLLALLSMYRGMPVICAKMNRDFAEWAGLHVLADYPRDEDMSIQMMYKVISEGHERKVKCVIDNQQSSGKIGRTIADNLDVPLVMLTNFPETGFEYSYLTALESNCARCIDALNNDSQKKGDSTK